MGGVSQKSRCLHCHEEVSASPRERWDCPACGRPNLPSMQADFWSLSPRVHGLQTALHVLTLLIPSFAALAVLEDGGPSASSAAVSLGLGILVLCIPWFMLVRGLRRRAVSWPSVSICLVFMAAVPASVGPTTAEGWLWMAAALCLPAGILAAVILAKGPRQSWVLDATAGVVPTRTERRDGRLPRARYCLHCFSGSVEEQAGGTLACADCGGLSRPNERRRYWNLNRGIAQFETLLKTLAVALALGVMVWGMTSGTIEFGFGVNQGWFFAFGPLAVATVVWMTIGKLRRHAYGFSPLIVWSVVAAPTIVGLLPVFLIARAFERWKTGLIRGEKKVEGRPALG